MKTLKLTFHTDAGHGWLKVNRADIDALGIADQISSYSYQKGDFVYLEEDCDASRFFEAAKAAGWILNMKDQNCAGYSAIRNYERFTNKVPA